MVLLDSLFGTVVSLQMYKRTQREALDYSHVRAMLEYFKSIEGSNTTRVLRNSPYILAYKKEYIPEFDRNKSEVVRELRLTEKEAGKIISSNAYILSRPPSHSIRPCVDYLTEKGFTIDEIRAVILKFPRILLLSKEKLASLEARLADIGIEGAKYKAVLLKFPPISMCMIFYRCSSASKDLTFIQSLVELYAVTLSASKVEASKQWLFKQGVECKEDLASLLIKFPQIVAHNTKLKLDEIVSYLKDDLKIPQKVIKAALVSAPDVFGRKLERIQRNIRSMEAIGLSQLEIGRVIYGYPGMLRIDLSAEPYASKIRFMEHYLALRPSSTLPVHPRYVSYSLERIASRAAFIRSKKGSTLGVTGWCSVNDETFAQKFGKTHVEEWFQFREGWRNSNEAALWLRNSNMQQ